MQIKNRHVSREEEEAEGHLITDLDSDTCSLVGSAGSEDLAVLKVLDVGSDDNAGRFCLWNTFS